MIKLRIDIVEDPQFAGHGRAKRYRVEKWVFEKKTGRTLEHSTYGTGLSLKDAHEAKAKINAAYLG